MGCGVPPTTASTRQLPPSTSLSAVATTASLPPPVKFFIAPTWLNPSVTRLPSTPTTWALVFTLAQTTMLRVLSAASTAGHCC